MASSVENPADQFEKINPKNDSQDSPKVCLCKEIINICEVMNKIFSTVITVLKAIIIIYIICLVYSMIHSPQPDGINVLPFVTNAETTLNGEDLASLLSFNLMNIQTINEQPIGIGSINSDQNISTHPSFKTKINLQELDLRKIRHDPGSVSAWGISLNPAQVILFLRDITNSSDPETLTENIQKFGSDLRILAVLNNPHSDEKNRIILCEVRRTLPNDNSSFNELIPVMIEELSFQIANNLIERNKTTNEKFPQEWQTFEYLTLGKKAYLRYNVTKNLSDLDTASNMVLNASHLEPDCSESSTLRSILGYAWYKEGYDLDDRGNYSDAIQALDQAIKLDPQNENTWSEEGFAYNSLPEYFNGLQACNRALELDPNLTIAWNNKGWALCGLSNYTEALQACNRALELDPNLAIAWYNKGVALEGLGKQEYAIKAYDEAIRLDPNDAEVWTNKGVTLDNQRKYDEAIKAYDEAIRIDPNDASAWNNKGGALKSLGRTAEADAAFAKAKELGYSE